MAEGFEYGGKSNGGNPDKLEHYRVEIRKLKQLNYQQKENYEKKIALLQQQLRTSSKSKQISFIDPTQNRNNEIIKRDKEINRLSEENERLKRENYRNPDRELLKKRDMFESIADKDQEIAKLKNVIYELENKYDGRYFNENRVKKDYQILQKQNQKLKKELQSYGGLQASKAQQISAEILQLMRYKKQNELLLKENEHLKKQLKKMIDERNSKRQPSLGQNTQIQVLKRDLKFTTDKNKQLYVTVEELEARIKKLMEELQSYKRNNRMSTLRMTEPAKKEDQGLYLSKKNNYDRQLISQSSEYENISIKSESPETMKKKGYYDEFQLGEVIKKDD